MLGKPKYNYKDVVQFEINGNIKVGVIEIIDSHGTFFDDSDVSYDVLVTEGEEKCLYKHINERLVTPVT